MANKFQSRLVRITIIIAVCIIVLPILFDTDKKCHNENEFAVIPFMPKVIDKHEIKPIAIINTKSSEKLSTSIINTMIFKATSDSRNKLVKDFTTQQQKILR